MTREKWFGAKRLGGWGLYWGRNDWGENSGETTRVCVRGREVLGGRVGWGGGARGHLGGMGGGGAKRLATKSLTLKLSSDGADTVLSGRAFQSRIDDGEENTLMSVDRAKWY